MEAPARASTANCWRCWGPRWLAGVGEERVAGSVALRRMHITWNLLVIENGRTDIPDLWRSRLIGQLLLQLKTWAILLPGLEPGRFWETLSPCSSSPSAWQPSRPRLRRSKPRRRLAAPWSS